MLMGKTSLVASRNSNLLAKYDVLEDILQNSFLNPILLVNKIPIIAQIWQEEGPIIKKYYPLVTMKPLKSLAWFIHIEACVYKGTDGFWAPPWPFCCVSLVWKLKFPTSCLSAALYLLSIEGGRKNDLRHKEWLWLNNLVFTAIELWVVDKSCHTPNSPSSFFIQHTEKCSSELHIIKVQIYLIICVVNKGGGLRVAWNLIKDVPSCVGTAALHKNSVQRRKIYSEQHEE